MKWQNYPDVKPETAGSYIVSIGMPMAGGKSLFNDSAIYDEEKNQWFKHDAFYRQNERQEEITKFVIGWIDDLGIYLGQF